MPKEPTRKKISPETKAKIEKRRELREQIKNQRELNRINKDISKDMKKDLRKYNKNEQVIRIIEENKRKKLLKKKLSMERKLILKLKDKNGRFTHNREVRTHEIEHSYIDAN